MIIKKIINIHLFIVIIFLSKTINSLNILNKNNSVNDHKNNNFIIFNTVREVLVECFPDNMKTVITTAELSQHINEYLCDCNYLLPLILINKNFKTIIEHQLYPELPTVILTTNSNENTKVLLLKLNSSPWWNVKAFFIFVGTWEYSCKNASEILHTAWKNKLLSSIFLCYQNYENVMMVYTYNPFTHHAPYPWKKHENGDHFNESWTLYEQIYQKGSLLCSSLKYNKLKYLDGYQINAVSTSRTSIDNEPTKKYNITSIKSKMNNYSWFIVENYLSALNVTPIIYYKKHGIFSDLANGLYDLLLSPRLVIHTSTNYSQSYPYIYLPIVIITHKSQFLTPLEKIRSFYDSYVVISTFAALLTLLTALMIHKYQSFMSAFLDIIRIMVQNSILQPLKNFPIKIHYFGVVWLMLIIYATIEGNMAAFLTRPGRNNIETIQNLIDMEYKIHIYEHLLEPFVKLKALSCEKNVVIQKSPNCFDQVVNDSRSACITFGLNVIQPAWKHDLHMSQPIYHVYLNYIGNRDFSLMTKIDFVLSRFMDLGILDYCYQRYYGNLKQKMEDQEAWETEFNTRPIEMMDINFAFVFYFICILCSFIVFLFEITFPKKFYATINHKKLFK